MLAFYLVTAILGTVLLVASVVTGHHLGGHGLEHGASHHDTDAHESIAANVISLRFLTYLMAFGGGTALLLRLLAGTREPWAGLLALVVGSISGIAAQVAIRHFAQGASGVATSRELAFKIGTLLLPASPGVSSLVRITVDNKLVDLIATTDDASIPAQAEVVIVEMREGIAHVTRNAPSGEQP